MIVVGIALYLFKNACAEKIPSGEIFWPSIKFSFLIFNLKIFNLKIFYKIFFSLQSMYFGN